MKAIMRNEREMKDSGVKWIGEIPTKWETRPVKALFSLTTGFTPDSKNEELYDENGLTWVTIGDMNNDVIFDSRQKISSKVAAQHAKEMTPKGALMYSFKLSVGNVAFAGKDLFTNEAIASFVPKANDGDLHFLKYASSLIIGNATTNIYGAKIMNQKLILNAPISLPESIIEQQLIADYLDDRCSKIDAIIAEAKASIEEYKELKQAVIYEAVTKGIDENATTYNTNNIWIPSLPENVPLSRLGLHYDVILGKMLCPKPRNEKDTLEPYICAANVHFDGVSGELKSMWFNDAEKSLYAVHCKDMLIVEGGAGAGGAAIVEEEPSTGTYIQNSIMIVRAKDCEDNRYARYLVEALVNRNYVDYVCNKATIPHFTKEKVSTIPYPVLSVDERIRISDYLDIKTKQMDALISEKQSLIEDLEAYKKSLIYDVVTGKRKVVA